MKLIILLWLFTSSAFAQMAFELDVSKKFETASSEAAVKEELLFEAALLGTYMAAEKLGYARPEFEKNLNQKFADYLNQIREKKLSEKFGINYKNTLSEAELKNFVSALEGERSNEWKKFTRASESIGSYTFRSLLQDPAAEDTWKAQVSIVLDKRKVLRLYRRVMSSEKKPYAKILLLPEINLENLSWSELGLESATSFMDPVRTSWMKWLDENIPASVEEVESCHASCYNFWQSWSETRQDDMGAKIPMEYSDSLWLKLDITLKKTNNDPVATQLGLIWSGRVVLLDTNTKRIIASFEMGEERRVFKGHDQQVINSHLASEIYRSPLGIFMQAVKITQEKVALNRLSRLVITGHRQLADALGVMEQLKTRGASLGLEVHLDTFTKTEAQFVCYYKGEEKSFTDLLSGLKELKLSQSYTLVNEFNGVHHVLKLVAE